MVYKHLRTLATASLLTGALSVSAFAANLGGATVTENSLKLSSEPSAEASALTAATQGTIVVIDSKVNDEWFKTIYNGITGYMPTASLNFSECLEGNIGSGNVFGTDIQVHEGASLDSGIVCTYDSGTEVEILGVYGPWYKVRCEGNIGFIFSDYLAMNTVPAAESAESAGQIIVDTAMEYLDTPYVWGGTTPKGFDCSGFVQYVYRQCGYTINRTARDIYKNGTYVEKANLEIGDAICFSSHTESIGHVGIYIGNGQFIHASSGSGHVIISDLSEDYYSARYVGARHIV